MEPIEILLIEDNPGDVSLTLETIRQAKLSNNIHVAINAAQALAFLRHEEGYTNVPSPDVVLLDSNLLPMDGYGILAEIKRDERLKHIPVVLVKNEELSTELLQVHSCITKPIDLKQFVNMIKSIEVFGLSIVKIFPATA
ncbi:MAG: response regulator [Anaerolineae bacterium]|nr:response regulator [Anaerolineae bacterium]